MPASPTGFLQHYNLQQYGINLFKFSWYFVENTRTVSKNLGCKTKCDDHMNANQVDVLIPEVIQVLSSSSSDAMGFASWITVELEHGTYESSA